MSHDNIDQGVCKHDGIKVIQVTFEFVVETDCTKREVDFFSSADGLLTKDDLLNLLLDGDENFDVAWVEGLEFVEEGLKFEKAELLDTLGGVSVEDLFDNFDAQDESILNSATVSAARGSTTRLLNVLGGGTSDRRFKVFFAGKEVTVRAELCKDCSDELETLGLNFPVLFIS